MPIHEWTRVDQGIFHAFHHGWIWHIAEVLNRGLLPDAFYALPEQQAGGFGPDVLTLGRVSGAGNGEAPAGGGRHAGQSTGLTVAPPKRAPVAETATTFYRRKQSSLAIRHVSGDDVVAVIEIVSPGNKSSVAAFRAFRDKAATLLMNGVHLMIVDLFPPGPRDPHGVHGMIWADVAGESYQPPPGRPLAAIAYEAEEGIRAFVDHMAVGEPVPDAPLFLGPNACVNPPLEATYQAAFAAMPLRWREILEQT